ncbi:MAG: C39 family peptidase [Ruminococcus sp.]|nr:C39 family peptidase [Ruminococcus sp.]
MKYIKIISAVTAAALLNSCVFEDDINYPQNSEISETTEAPTVEITDVPAFEEFDSYSGYQNYFYHVDADDSEGNSEKTEPDYAELPAEETTESEEVTENPTEAETEAQTELPVTTKGASKESTSSHEYSTAGFIDVPFLSQEKCPKGCELVSIAMILAYYGIEIEPVQLIEEGYMEFVAVERRGGVLYGGDPNKVFVGDPRGDTGYGCYSGAVGKCLEKFLEYDFFDVHYLNDMSLKDICSQYIDFGQPVIIWASVDMESLEEKEYCIWTIEETGEQFGWISNEHCMVLVGYDDNYYYFHDPRHNAFTPYKRSIVEKRFKEMGSQAVTVVSW